MTPLQEAVLFICIGFAILGSVFYFGVWLPIQTMHTQLVAYVCPNITISYATCYNQSINELSNLQQQIFTQHIKVSP
jgi:hypothetical protein